MPTVFKSVSLNLLEPSGPVQACNGIALPLYICSLNSVENVLPVCLVYFGRQSSYFNWYNYATYVVLISLFYYITQVTVT